MRGIHSTKLCLLVLVVCFVFVLGPNVATAQDQGQLYVAVSDQFGEPVLDLTPDEFKLNMDGTPLTLVSTSLDNASPRIAYLVDLGDVMFHERADSNLRVAFETFLSILNPEYEVGLFTISPQIRQREAFTTDREELIDASEYLHTEVGTGSSMMDGLFETWERRFKPEDSWPMFVLLVADTIDMSSFFTPEEYNEFVLELVTRQATVHAVLLSNTIGGQSFQYAANLAKNTGGRNLMVNTASGFPGQLSSLAEQINSHADQVSVRYRLVYEVPGTYAGEGELSLSLNRPGVSMQLFGGRDIPQ